MQTWRILLCLDLPKDSSFWQSDSHHVSLYQLQCLKLSGISNFWISQAENPAQGLYKERLLSSVIFLLLTDRKASSPNWLGQGSWMTVGVCIEVWKFGDIPSRELFREYVQGSSNQDVRSAYSWRWYEVNSLEPACQRKLQLLHDIISEQGKKTSKNNLQQYANIASIMIGWWGLVMSSSADFSRFFLLELNT